MKNFLLSVVFVIRNEGDSIAEIIKETTIYLQNLVEDYELIIVDNASSDNTFFALKELIGVNGYANLQIYRLTGVVDFDTASWAGLENSLGDYVIVMNPLVDDIRLIEEMLDATSLGVDVVFTRNLTVNKQNLFFRFSNSVFNYLFEIFNGVSLERDAPQYRALSKKIINFILQHPNPASSYRYLPVTSGFLRKNIEYSFSPKKAQKKYLLDGIDRGLKILVSTTQGPMRMVTYLTLAGAAFNLFYSFFVVGIALFKTEIAPGWISLSLQQSTMFFLISVVLLVMSEYMLNMLRISTRIPEYHIGDELTSARIIRREKLNLEEIRH